MTRNILTIAGTDPSGGAGIHADIKAFSAMKTYGMGVVTAVVAQNTHGVQSVQTLDASFVTAQLESVFNDVQVDAVKIGMIANAEIAEAITDVLDRYEHGPVVLDPVMVAKSGDRLLASEAIAAVKEMLVPRATMITPNLPEAAVLLGASTEPASLEAMYDLILDARELGSEWVLLKGGHLDGEESTDLLVGETVHELSLPRVLTKNSHGTGCTLSAAIAALLPDHGTVKSVQCAKEYLTLALRNADALNVGSGHGPVHHFHKLWNLATGVC